MIDKHESITAKLCSFVRAFHSIYEKNKVFDDYLAYDLMGQEEYIKVGQLIEHNFDVNLYDDKAHFYRENVENIVNSLMAPIVLSRIAYAEEKLKEFKKKYQKVQYVILGAGFDTFAFRNSDKDIDVFELDHADTGRYKRKRVKELSLVIPDNLHFLSIDFNKESLDEVLLKGGFDRTIPSVFTILGVSYYLNLETFEQTLSLIDSVTDNDSLVIFDYPDQSTFKTSDERVNTLSAMTEKLGEKMIHGYSFFELKSALNRHHFDVLENITPENMDERYYSEHQSRGMKAFPNVNILTGIKHV